MIDPLTLDQMRVLVAVAETGSFSAASRKLGRVQSAVSQAVRAMETTLGVALFDRSTKTNRPYDRGRGGDRSGRPRDRRQRQGAACARPEHRRGRRARIDARDRRHLPDAVIDGEPARAARGAFPKLPATVFHRSARRRRGGPCSAARRAWAIFPLVAGPTPDISAEFSPHHDRARPGRRLRPSAGPGGRADRPRNAGAPCPTRADRQNRRFAQNLRGGIVSHHLWRFADLTTRLEFLLAGFGWCNMPHHMVEDHVASGRLKRLVLADDPAPVFRLYVASERGRELGRAGKWLVADLCERLKTCPGVAHRRSSTRGEESRRRRKGRRRRPPAQRRSHLIAKR